MKIYLSKLNESWVVDRFRADWYLNNPGLSTENLKEADIIWIISPWTWNKISKKHLKRKKVVCSIYHIDFESFDEKEEQEFYKRDKYVHSYHVISKKTEEQLRSLTDKKITSIPFWVDQKIWKKLNNKNELRSKYGFNSNDFVIGSFQRDTEGKDLTSPKLIKGPDIFLEIVTNISLKNSNIIVLLTGKRRNYLIKNFEERNINYKYLEMVDLKELNELYNVLDLYVVSSRIEGGPQAIMECAITETPVVSTDVGIASEILNQESIYKSIEQFHKAQPNTEFALQKAKSFTIPKGMESYIKMFEEVYES